MIDIVSIVSGVAVVLPIAIAAVGLYAHQVRKSREALIDKHNAELAAKDFLLASRDVDLKSVLGQVQILDQQLRLAHEVQAAVQAMRLLPSAERRADPSLQDKSYEIIPLAKVADFYDSIAPYYNKRNTGKYLATYIEIYQAIIASIDSIDGARICDLGGGTGFLLHRLQQHSVSWLNVDISQGALRVFRDDFNFYDKKETRNLDVGRDQFVRQNEVFDVVVMSYLWSSMDQSPDLDQVHSAMHDGSVLVVADNHFAYVDENRHYGFTDVRGVNLAIAPRPMVPSELRALVIARGFSEVAFKEIAIDGKPYSQLHVFRKTS